MTSSQQHTVTPADNPIFFPLDWRHQVASHWAGERRMVKNSDEVVTLWIRHIRGDRRLSRAQRDRLSTTEEWTDSPMAGVLQPMLLTDLNYEAIAADLGGLDAEAVRLYEMTFFNVRTDDGQLRPKHVLFAKFMSNDGAWSDVHRAALLCGRDGLHDALGLLPTRDEDRLRNEATARATQSMAGQELFRRMLRGEVDTRDLLKIKQIQLDAQRLQHELQTQEGSDSEAMGLVRKILELTAPKLAPLPDVDHEEEMNATIRRKLAEERIKKEPVPDQGMPTAAELNRRRVESRLAQVAFAEPAA